MIAIDEEIQFTLKKEANRKKKKKQKSTINRFVICLLEQHIFATYIFHHVTCV